MNFLNSATALLPFGKKEEKKEYFFALNIGAERIIAALWTIEGKELKILEIASQNYSGAQADDEIITVTDRLLDQVLGLKEIEPQKILFGVPDSWVLDDNLKDPYLKLLRSLVKELELTPMAYVASGNALVHFLEKQEGIPTTVILVGFGKLHLTVTVVRAGKIDGVKLVSRGTNCASDIEKALLTFTDVETLPSKLLIYGVEAEELKSQLLSFSWMSKLSFLHFPKIEVLQDDIEIKSTCLAGGSEINGDIKFVERPVGHRAIKSGVIAGEESEQTRPDKSEDRKISKSVTPLSDSNEQEDNFGFMVGDVVSQKASESADHSVSELELSESEDEQISDSEKDSEDSPRPSSDLAITDEHSLEIDDFEQGIQRSSEPPKKEHKKKFGLKAFLPMKNFKINLILLGLISAGTLLIGAYLFLLKADIKVFVEPKILEKDAQVIADPNQKAVNEEGKIIPGQLINVEVSGTAKDAATGKKQIGDPAKGTVVIYNKTSDSQSLSKGTQVTGPGGIKFTLDTSVSIASQSASDSGITFGKATTTATATAIGADGNLPSASDFTIAGYSQDKVAAKSEGNFSGGTSKDVTVVSNDDQQKLLAKLSSDLRQQAQQKLQEKYPDQKILQEALSESITKKSYNKNIGDQAGEFSLNLTINYKGTAFKDTDLKTIVSKLVDTQVPDGFQLDITETETQAEVSKLEKDGKLIFLARFKAKLIPKIDTDKIKSQVKLKTPAEVKDMLKGMENVLDSEIKMSPNVPSVLARMPILSNNIKVEVGLK